MGKCAFMDRECTSECVAHVPTSGSDLREGYHFTFECARVDAMYDIAGSLLHIREKLEGGLDIRGDITNRAGD